MFQVTDSRHVKQQGEANCKENPEIVTHKLPKHIPNRITLNVVFLKRSPANQSTISWSAVGSISQTVAQNQPQSDEEWNAIAYNVAQPHEISHEIGLLHAQYQEVEIHR